MKFEELGLSEPILRAVSAAGYSTPTPIQAAAIPEALAGRDVLGCAQTGTGKTAAFSLPILHRLTAAGNPPAGRGRRIRALVLSPTRELAQQIGDNVHAYGRHTSLKQAVIVGGVNQNGQTRALQNGIDILIATPGRLIDLIDQGYVNLSSVEVLVLDEADRMLDMGFIPAVRRIVGLVPKERQTLFFSATMPDDIRRLADVMLRNPAQVKVTPVKSTAELIEQSVYHVHRQHKPHLLSHLLSTGPLTRALVFTRTKHGADRVVRQLERANIRSEAIHGNKSQSARQRTLANFKTHRIQILVATDIAARGIDVEGISHVYNYDLPEQAETYVHRIGRTGRAGATGIAVSFCDAEEREYLTDIERLIRQRLEVIEKHPEYPAITAGDGGGGRRPQRGGSGKPQGARRGGPKKPPRKAGARSGESRGSRRDGNGARSETARPATTGGNNQRARRVPGGLFGIKKKRPPRKAFAAGL